MRVGEKGSIRKLEDRELRVKLMEMGCLPGARIVVENIAPMGDPMAIRVAGYSLSLRKQDASGIWIDPE